MSEIDHLRDRRFVVHAGFVFFAKEATNDERILRCIESFGPARAQDLMNYEPLRSYIENLEEQEQIGKELQRIWSAKLQQEFPEMGTQVLVEKGEGTWKITVKNV